MQRLILGSFIAGSGQRVGIPGRLLRRGPLRGFPARGRSCGAPEGWLRGLVVCEAIR